MICRGLRTTQTGHVSTQSRMTLQWFERPIRFSSKVGALDTPLKPNSITLAGSEMARSWFEPDNVMEFGFEPVCDQLRTS